MNRFANLIVTLTMLVIVSVAHAYTITPKQATGFLKSLKLEPSKDNTPHQTGSCVYLFQIAKDDSSAFLSLSEDGQTSDVFDGPQFTTIENKGQSVTVGVVKFSDGFSLRETVYNEGHYGHTQTVATIVLHGKHLVATSQLTDGSTDPKLTTECDLEN
jgi:hypothetical protein